MEKQKHRKKFIPWKKILLVVILVALVAGAVCFSCRYHVDSIAVADTFRSEPGDIQDYVFPDEESTVFYRVVWKALKGMDAPAFSNLYIKFSGVISVSIRGTENTPILQVDNGTETYYFDENGYRVPAANTEEKVSLFVDFSVPETALYEKPKLSEEQAEAFETALQIAVYVKALNIPSDYITMTEIGAVLAFQSVNVALGSSDHLREKLEEVVCQYLYYEGLKGTLHMENYDGSNSGKGFYFTTNE